MHLHTLARAALPDAAGRRSGPLDARLPPGHRRSGASAGFTLIELSIVMAIIVILAGISLGLYTNSIRSANEAVLKQNLFVMREALDQYYADKNKYPPNLGALAEEKYLRGIPEDPFTGSTDTWQEVLSEPDPGNPADQPGVFDVKSGSDRTALDGTPYADW
jgi:general secretion pathway protein G